MRAARLLPVTIVVVLLVALVSWWPGGRPDDVDPDLVAPLVAAAGGESALSATWYCAAGTADTPSGTAHALVLTNASDRAVEARLTAYGADGVAASTVTEVPAASVQSTRVRDLGGGDDAAVMVETSAGELTVEHRLTTQGAGDQATCATAPSEEWYFPVQQTSQVATDEGEVTATSATRLVLFNPFSQDAGVNVTAAGEDDLRAPAEWTGIVVRAGTTRVVDIGEFAVRRDQISLSVVARNGRIVAETVQSLVAVDGERRRATGIRMQGGVPAPAARWDFAGGFSGEGVRERLVVHNPGGTTASVVVQVVPVGGASMPPEPFELDVASRRYGVIDLSAEGRIPGEGYHSIQVETDAETPIVVGRVLDVSGGPAELEGEATPEVVRRPSIEGGTTIGTGSPLASTAWIVPDLLVGEGQDPAVVFHNPGEGIVAVTARLLGAEGGGLLLLDGVEVPAGDGVVLRLSDHEIAAGHVGLVVESDSPVLVERVFTFGDQNDLTMGLAVPVRPVAGGSFPSIGSL